jgi:hypothetical protein
VGTADQAIILVRKLHRRVARDLGATTIDVAAPTKKTQGSPKRT